MDGDLADRVGGYARTVRSTVVYVTADDDDGGRREGGRLHFDSLV